MDEQKKPFSEFAVVSLVIGVLSFVTLFGLEKAILAVVFGFLALRRIGKNSQLRGRGLAIAGVVLGAVAVVLLIIIGVYFLSQASLRARNAQPKPPVQSQ